MPSINDSQVLRVKVENTPNAITIVSEMMMNLPRTLVVRGHHISVQQIQTAIKMPLVTGIQKRASTAS